MGTEMNGESASVQAIACRFLCFVLALFVYGADPSCATGQAVSNTIKSFQDDARRKGLHLQLSPHPLLSKPRRKPKVAQPVSVRWGAACYACFFLPPFILSL